MTTTRLAPLLHGMTSDQLIRAAGDRRWPKWSTMCLLRQLGLPVLNACLVQPHWSTEELCIAIKRLAASAGVTRLMLRSDGGVETRQYYRGGNSFPLNDLEPRATALQQAGRAVLLLEPTNRLTNRLSVLLRMERPARGQPGRFVVEALGPGYDVGDLTRGGISPQVTAVVEGVDWSQYDTPSWGDLKIRRDLAPTAEHTRRRRRLERLVAYELLDDNLAPAGSRIAVESWPPTCDPTLTVVRRVRSWFEDAFIIASAKRNRDWTCLATSLSDLGCGQTVYWDVIDGASKYGIGADHRR